MMTGLCNTGKGFMKMYFGAACFRMMDISPVNDQNAHNCALFVFCTMRYGAF
jgi:hypothetical protein